MVTIGVAHGLEKGSIMRVLGFRDHVTYLYSIYSLGGSGDLVSSCFTDLSVS